ncbi:MAG: flagellar biosynthesis protein FlhF [Firmicutes bacterium HGW-Firmicutes-1]|nr:MAG: flagellar biosynthesis protein FlhF [Firmicutes bacterium HGW-Firmicutes-1]
MKIKKYEGSTEKEAMLKVKDELGKEALIVSVKNIKPKGFYKIFKKPYVEVTAAVDDKGILNNDKFADKRAEGFSQGKNANLELDPSQEDSTFVQLLKTLADSKHIADSNHLTDLKKNEQEQRLIKKSAEEQVDKMNMTHDQPFLKVVYEQLIENDLDEIYVNQLMLGLGELSYDQKATIDDVVSIVYKRIVKLLTDLETIKLTKGKTKTVAFVGPTGVGKTTTIAKIASYFTLNLEKKVALITADTYRIAAVEQLRTYANILNIPIKVVYTATELKDAIESFKGVDLILIDTAGRSHKNQEHQNELSKLLNEIEEKELYLVLSLATKYKDLIKITDAYNDISAYKLIFTKLDETSSYGNILNVKLKTNALLSYVTFGQNVPDDISEVNVHEIAKKILGGCES